MLELTFIILARPESDNDTSTDSDSLFDAVRMIGDVNLFLKGSPSTNAGNDGDGGDGDDDAEAEVEIMIAGVCALLDQPIATAVIRHPMS